MICPHIFEVVGLVRRKLNSENHGRFKGSVFGNWLELEEIKGQNQLLYLLFMRIQDTSLQSGEIVFKIDDHTLKFGPNEFMAITGLRFDTKTDTHKTCSDFHKRFIKGKEPLYMKNIMDAFRQECDKSGGSSDDSLRLALLMVLYGCLLAGNQNQRKVEMKYLHLADDLEKFNLFPWGSIGYEYLVDATHQAKRKIDNQSKTNKEVRFAAHGFSHAILVFLYEIHPAVANDCATVKEGNWGSFPRMLKWRSKEPRRYESVAKYFESREYTNGLVRSLPSCFQCNLKSEIELQ